MMKKQYVTPYQHENTFDFCDSIAYEVNPDQSTSDVFAKERQDNSDNPNAYGQESEWQNGLW